MGLGMIPLGLVFGALVVQSGLDWWRAGLSAALISGGSFEFLLIGMVTVAAPPVSIVVAAFLVNARQVFYALSSPHRVRGCLGKTYSTFALTARAPAACRVGRSIAEKRSVARQPPTCSLRCAARMRNCSRDWRTASSIRVGPWRPRPTAFARRTAVAGPMRPAHGAGRRRPGAAVTTGPHGARGLLTPTTAPMCSGHDGRECAVGETVRRRGRRIFG
ncbi:AzlC family ABC transporter permease [Streptomyces sp. MA15]|uniref:AzlC family ABC transporter permease n=1 Tax=Streptomyces sp. MA15 TaxID=3055061 RepID=UPI0025AF364F|nr:AzlC family ABC transporter permease [Streptomyces sp. MA15]MDN3271954.1 AzlC family ABC transporter permease [Streptomyces sp. MA15]